MKKLKRYTLEELLKNCDPSRPISPEEQEILDIAPVGREFGSGSPHDPARGMDKLGEPDE